MRNLLPLILIFLISITLKAEVKLKMLINENEVIIGIPGKFRLSGELRQRVRKIPGILDMQEL